MNAWYVLEEWNKHLVTDVFSLVMSLVTARMRLFALVASSLVTE